MEGLINVKELATLLKVPVSWIYDRTRNGGPEKIPHYKIGKYIRFSPAQIATYLDRIKSRDL